MLQKNGFILLFSESHRLLCNKNLSDTTISWGQFLTYNEYWMNPGAIGTIMILRVQRL